MSGQTDNRPMNLNLSLFFVIGIFALILPGLFNIFNITLPSWLFKVGIGFIIFGVIDMVFLRWAIV